MRTGAGTDPFKSHREALLLGAVRVFCTYVQHDVARMIHAGFEGDPQVVFRAAVKHQMLRGQGKPIASVVHKIIHHDTNTPVLHSAEDRQLLACIMNDYATAKAAVEQGPEAFEQYKSESMVPGIMCAGSTIFPAEESEEDVDRFVQSVRQGIDAWPAFQPEPGFETIVHNMV